MKNAKMAYASPKTLINILWADVGAENGPMLQVLHVNASVPIVSVDPDKQLALHVPWFELKNANGPVG
jgi:hypothetical protein